MKNFRNVIILLLAMSVLMFASITFAEEKAPGTVILKGAPMGGVKFDHAAHAKATKCDTCHHASKPEKALASAHQNCQVCHTSKVVAPMKTDTKTAMHTTCIECHKKAAKGPTKCTECHQKANV